MLHLVDSLAFGPPEPLILPADGAGDVPVRLPIVVTAEVCPPRDDTECFLIVRRRHAGRAPLPRAGVRFSHDEHACYLPEGERLHVLSSRDVLVDRALSAQATANKRLWGQGGDGLTVHAAVRCRGARPWDSRDHGCAFAACQ